MKRILFLTLLFLLALPPAANAQSSAAIRIVKPGDRRNVELGQISVTVEITGVALTDGYTWQVWIDNDPQGMVRNATETNITIPEPSGPHRLRAELYDPKGAMIASNEILVLAAPVEDHNPLFNPAWFSPLMLGFTIIVIGLVVFSLRIHPRKAA